MAASSFTTDFYKILINPKATAAELVRMSRMMIIVVSALSLVLAMNPDSMILNIVPTPGPVSGPPSGPWCCSPCSGAG